MYNYQPITPSPSNQQQKSPQQNGQENLYTQIYQCNCSQTFKNLADYNSHIINENHQLNLSIPLTNNISSQKGFVQQAQKQSQLMKKANHLEFSSNPIHHQMNVPFEKNMNSIGDRQLQYFQRLQRSEEIPSYKQVQNLYINPNLQQKNKQIQLQEKQISFKYIEAYYKSKLDPFYRQFDIDPQKTFTNQRQSQKLNNFQSEQMNRKKQASQSKNTREDGKKDLNKVLQQLQVRMIPAQNGIIEFIDIFMKENHSVITKVSEEQIQAIPKKLNASLKDFNLLCEMKRYNRIKKSEQFMDSDLDLVIEMFVEFLKQILRRNEIWIAYSMLFIVIDSIKKFYLLHQNEIHQNLKISDITLVFNTIKQHSETACKQLPLIITAETTLQFLIWFSQWFTMVQYVKNKWNIGFIEPLIMNVHQINYLYQENVRTYQKCILNKRNSFALRSKRKFIEKEKMKSQQHKQQLDFIQKLNKSHCTSGNYVNGDINFSARNQLGKQFFNRQSKSRHTTKQSNQGYKSHIQASSLDEFKKQEYGTNRWAQRTQNPKRYSQQHQMNNFAQNFSQMQYPFAYTAKQRKIQNKLQQNQTPHSKQRSQQGSERQHQIDELDSKMLYLPVFQSQYVSYFSSEAEQIRRKEKQLWIGKVEKLNQIIANPIEFKPSMKEEIARQLKQVQQLTNLLQFDLRMINFYKKDFSQINKEQFLSRNLQFETNPNSNIIHISSASDRQDSRPIDNDRDDPFIIKRNFRNRRFDRCLINSENLQKGTITIKMKEQQEKIESKNKIEEECKMANDASAENKDSLVLNEEIAKSLSNDISGELF